MKREYFYTNFYDLFAEFRICQNCNDWVIETRDDFKREFDFFEEMLRDTDLLCKQSRTEDYDYDPENDDGFVFFTSSAQNVEGAYARHHFDPELFSDADAACRFYEKRYEIELH